jgi:hypothetical protein
VKLPRDSITQADAEKIRNLATSIVFKLADCGPERDSTIDGHPVKITRISGFEARKARDIAEEMIFDFLLKGY